MKKYLVILAILPLAGCISPNWIRLAPENKDIDAEVNTVYGHVTIHSRVNPQGTNPLLPLPAPAAQTIYVPAPTLSTPRTTPLPVIQTP